MSGSSLPERWVCQKVSFIHLPVHVFNSLLTEHPQNSGAGSEGGHMTRARRTEPHVLGFGSIAMITTEWPRLTYDDR